MNHYYTVDSVTKYAMYHEHDCNYNPPWDPYDGCPSEAYDTD